MWSLHQILAESQTNKNFVPSISLKELGERAFAANLSPEPHWPTAMRQGWQQALRHTADADTSAYLVSRGEVS